MVKFKHLFKDNMPPLPKTVKEKKQRWEVVKFFPDPYEPVQPEDYISAKTPVKAMVSQRGASDDEVSEASIDMFQV